jgi:hypothetical protein
METLLAGWAYAEAKFTKNVERIAVARRFTLSSSASSDWLLGDLEITEALQGGVHDELGDRIGFA